MSNPRGLLSYNDLMTIVATKILDQGDSPDLSLVNAASIDIRLGKTIYREDNPYSGFNPNGYSPQVISLAKREPLKMFPQDTTNGVILRPGEFILASSIEIFNLPDWIAAEYKLKSSLARVGLDHLNAGWCDPGWHGSVLTLELRNLTTYHHIELKYGDKIGQMVFFACEPVPEEASYRTKGAYNGDKTAQVVKQERGPKTEVIEDVILSSREALAAIDSALQEDKL